MIRLPGPAALPAADRRALTLLADFARLVPVTDASADVVTLDLVDRPDAFASLRAWRAAGWGIEPADGVVRVARAALRCVREVVDATAERDSTERDRFARVPAEVNALVREGLEREPLVSLAATAFRAAALVAAGRRQCRLAAPWPDGRRWAVAVTHDLDVVAWWPAFAALRLVELTRKGEWRRAARALGAAAVAGRQPVFRGVEHLLAAERSRGIRSTWFVLCGTPTWRSAAAGDLTYVPESAATRRILDAITQNGHAIGLHGSFATVRSGATMRQQRTRLEALVGRPIQGVRQHFLRFDPARTPQAMSEAGFQFDSTAGFPDRNGYRLGVADLVPGPDPDSVEEVPFAWMDRALSKYKGIEAPEAWIEDALELAAAARTVEGVWVGVWHPNLTPALGYPDASVAYERLLDRLLAERPHVAPLEDLVAWRRARRYLHIERLAPDGRLDLGQGVAIPLDEATS